jgi:hypothetical protein
LSGAAFGLKVIAMNDDLGAREPADKTADERTLQFDPRCLDVGDRVDVFLESERRWTRGTFEISTAGVAFVRMTDGESIHFGAALRMGLRRTLN